MTKEYLRVSELNQFIQDIIRAGFPQPVWLCGEIQGFNRNRSKNHIFFELVEKDPNSKTIIAKIGLVLFAGRKTHINDILKRSENTFALKDDIEVKLACSIDFYPPHGSVRLIVESVDPTYTLGRFAQEKQKLIALLKKNGTLEKNKTLPLPLVPLNIGLITSDDSAAHNDFYSELQKSGFGFKLYLRNATMQGVNTEGDICRAIDQLSQNTQLNLIVITRGGGSIADLSCFDSKQIAEKIAACRLPVLAGIGHEINISITDMAAHTYAKTPTAIAQFLVHRVQYFLDDIHEKLKRVMDQARENIEDEKGRLKNCALGLQENTREYLKGHTEQIIRLREVIKSRPVVLLRDAQRSVSEQENSLKEGIQKYFMNHCRKLNNHEKIIDIVHPVNTMKRGFSITRMKDGGVLKSIASLDDCEELTTEIVDGIIVSKVKSIK